MKINNKMKKNKRRKNKNNRLMKYQYNHMERKKKKSKRRKNMKWKEKVGGNKGDKQIYRNLIMILIQAKKSNLIL